MSFYSSSSFLSTSNSTYSCLNNSVNSLSNSSFYNDIYRSYSNLKQMPKTFSTYLPPTYVKRPSFFDCKRASDYSTKTPTGSTINIEKTNTNKPTSGINVSNASLSNIKIEDHRTNIGNNSYDDMTKSTASIESLIKDDSLLSPTRLNDSNELAASAVSNIQLNVTDDLMTQVDYYLNEVDNRMTCSGRQVEIESYDLSMKSGLISKCIYINELLLEANLSEANLESDPIFTQNGKSILIFSNKKDAEDFTNRHNGKFTVSFNNNEQDKLKKKNVSFIENENDDNDNDKKPVLKSANNRLSSTPLTKSSNNITGRSTVAVVQPGSNSATNFSNSNNENILISANTSKKNKLEGYEILTIRAKLKQRVGQNRTKHVTLGDIDSIMRNVVSIIQDEFMKRFPSGPSVALTDGSDSPVSRN